MSSISAAQIKAARALLDWSQEDLAEASGISISTIRTMELGKAPRACTLLDIRNALQRNGLEFIDGDGVKRRNTTVTTLRGADSCDSFFEDVLNTVSKRGGDVFFFTKSQDVLTRKSGMDNLSNIDRLNVVHRHADVKCLLMDAVEQSFLMPAFPCRMMPYKSLGVSSSIIYGDKYAHIMPDGHMDLMVVIFGVAPMINQDRRDFTSMWQNALPITTQLANKSRN